ncbi:MAG: hypothetical protein SRB2_03947 [Desulfobacteraceae bacterium Eth-SRB2]|nr:MAG: hypothetical protein SRB2_03947 [Desulfobacteraceae bacterium Eth-SRB2]
MLDTIKSCRYRLFVLVIVSFVFFACGAGQRLAGLQADFERLYIAKLEFKDSLKNREAWSSIEDIETALQGVSLEAREAAASKDLQTPTKIALLRLAMIAAWQGKEDNEKYVAGIVERGRELCVTLAPTAPTRDCALLLIMPSAMASSNIPASLAVELEESFSDNNFNHLPLKYKPKAKFYFNSMRAVFETVLDTFANSQLPSYLNRHERLLNYYKKELTHYSERMGDARLYASEMEGGTIISQNEIEFAKCSEGWVGQVLNTKKGEFPGILDKSAKECLRKLNK